MVKRFTVFLILALGLSFGIYKLFIQKAPALVMKDFDKQRDTQFILDIFKDNYYWLVDESSTEFSPQYMMDNFAPNHKPEDLGKLTIKVLYCGHTPVGFTAYWMRKFYEGHIIFVAIKKEFRCKGYAQLMVNYAFNDLASRDATVVRLITRITNYAGNKLYPTCGFKEYLREDGYVYYQKEVR